MKKLALLALFGLSTCIYAADGATLYKSKCALCHGQNAEVKYLGKVPPLSTLDAKQIKEDVKAYKAGTLNKFNLAPLMKAQIASLSDADVDAVADYIQTLKK